MATNTEKCLAVVSVALAETHTPGEVKALQEPIFEAFERRKNLLKAQLNLDDYNAGIQAAQQLGDEVKIMSYVAKRNAALNVIHRTRHVAWIQEHFGNNMARGLESIMAGVQSAKFGTRLSAMSEQNQLKHYYLTGLGEDLRASGVWELFIKGDKQFDKDTHAAWYYLGAADEAAQHAKLNPEAVKTAKLLANWTERARLDANEAGAWIGKLENWAGRQTHNPELLDHYKLPTYMEDAKQWFDLPRMSAQHETSNIDEMIKGVYASLVTNVHEADLAIGVGNVGTANIGKSMSQSRTIHFKDAESAWAYNQKYGGAFSPNLVFGERFVNNQSLANSVLHQLQNMSQQTGLMRVLGPNPQYMVKGIKDDLRGILRDQVRTGEQKLTKANVDYLQSHEHFLDTLLMVLDGSANHVGSNMGARIFQTARNWTQLTSLGGMLLSQFSDVVQHMSGSSYRGKGYLSGLDESVRGLFGTNLKDPENRKLAASLGVMVDNFMGEMARAGSFDVPGNTSKMIQYFYKANGANWWNSHMRFAAAAGLSHDVAQDAGKAWAELHPSMQRVLGQYGMGAKEWEIVRSSPPSAVGGRNYIVPENISDKTVQEQYKTFITDQTTYSQLDPDAKTRARLIGRSQPGTVGGEIARSVVLFKSFTTAFMEKTIGRELYGRGFEREAGRGATFTDPFKAVVSGGGGLAIANIVVMATAFGYLSVVAKDIARGVMPQDLTKLDNTQLIKLIERALVQGGGLGIYGDFLLGQANRVGGNFLETAAGPVVGRVAGIPDFWLQVKSEMEKGTLKPDLGAKLWKGVVSSVPGNNLFWIKWGLDHFINYRVQEALNPGFLARREAQMRRDSQQQFIVRPQTGSLVR